MPTFTLSKKIGYHAGGQKIETDQVEINGPSKKQFVVTLPLQQIVSLAMFKAGRLSQGEKAAKAVKESKDGKEVKIEADDIKMLLMIGEADLPKCLEIFSGLAQSGCVQVNGVNINHLQWDDIDQADQMQICYHFLADFIIPLI